MNEEEIRALQDAMEEMRRNGALSSDSLSRLNTSASKASQGVDKFGKTAGTVAASLGRAVNDLSKAGGSFNNLTGTIDTLASGTKFLTDKFGFAGKALGVAVDAFAGAAKFVINQLQEVAGNYQALGDVSATAADGITGLQRQFQQMGLVSLPAFTKSLASNTTGLAIFGRGMVGAAEEFSKLSGALTTGETAERFLRLGINLDQVGASAANYAAAQARFGGITRQQLDGLAGSTRKYIEELDLIARMTGNTRQQQEQEQQKSLADARFRAKIFEMIANGQGEQAEELQKYVNGLGGAAGDAARALVTGVPLTEEATRANQLFNDTIRQNVNAIRNGAKATQAIENTMEGAAVGVEKFGKTIQYTGTEAFGAATTQAYDFASFIRTRNEFLAKGETLEEANRKAQEALKKGTDATTNEFAKSQRAITETGKNLQQLQMALALKATPAVETFSNALDAASKKIMKIFGVKPTGPETAPPGAAPASGAKPTGAATAPITGATPAAKMAESATVAGGTVAAGLGPPRTVPGSAVAPTVGPGAVSLGNIREMISGVESRGNYNVVVGGQTYPLTTMTVAEVMNLQKKLIGEGKDSAAGKYQIKYTTLAGIMGKAGVSRDDKFDEAVQDKLANALIMQRGFEQYNRNPTQESKERFLANLSREWAGLPSGPMGESYYKGVGNNKAGMSWEKALQSFDLGGIATGPMTGYQAVLHGIEAVVPLPDGRTIPVEMRGINESFANQTGMLEAQIGRLDELIRVMRDQVSVSTKILQYNQ